MWLVAKLNLTKELGRKEILVPHLNNWFARGEFPDEIPIKIHMNKEKDDAFHPSSASLCARHIYALREEHLPKANTMGQTYKTFMFGHYAHAVLQWVVVEGLGFATWDDIEREFDFHFETEAGNPYRIRGFTDVAFCNVPGQDAPLLIDIKTMQARLYAMNELPGFLKEKYEAQVKMYLAFAELEKAIVLLVEKDSPHRYKEHYVYVDEQFVDTVIDKWEHVVDSQVNGEIPDCTCESPLDCPVKDYYEFGINSKTTETEEAAKQAPAASS